MKTVLELAQQAVNATQDNLDGAALTILDVLELLDVRGGRNIHLKNPLNQAGRGFRAREQALLGAEPVNGEYLALTYCAHDPFIFLDDYDDVQSLEQALASNAGIVNRFITYRIAFINGTVAAYDIAYVGEDGSTTTFDKHFQITQGQHAAERASQRWVLWRRRT